MSLSKEVLAERLALFLGEELDVQHLEAVKHLSFKHYKKGDIIFRAGEVCRSSFYLYSGLVRCYYIFDDKEVNLRLLCDDSIVLAYSSHFLQQASEETLQCLQDCSGVMIYHNRLTQEAKKNVSWLKYELLIAQGHYLSMERRLKTLQYKSLVDRYEYFMQVMEQKIVQETPAVHVASYLGTTPESLSRIKAQLNAC